MSSAIVQVQHLSKKYRIRHWHEQRYTVLRDVISDKFKAAFSVAAGRPSVSGRSQRIEAEDFWALKDVSFEVRHGEVLGIVGRNGSGKSTLLKLLSRITEPTEGRAVLNGRVASLLEVGTGFHPELSGRENIYLNGAILGMTRNHIKRRFDDIVAFAEVDKFIDTPVKRYSSGMYVRLAFAVAAYLEPDILIIDEVLAVGDSQFQKKCIGKLREGGAQGQTVLVVSHNMAVLTSLCKRVIWLSEGRLKMDDDVERVVSHYLREGAEQSGEVSLRSRVQDNSFSFTKLRFVDSKGDVASAFDVREPIVLHIEYEAKGRIADLELTLRVYNSYGIPIFSTNRSGSLAAGVSPGKYVSILKIPAAFLCPGSYSVDVAAHIPNVQVLCDLQSVAVFSVEETGSNMAVYRGNAHGVVLLDVPWHESRNG